ncbi:HNH endonuclease [Acididesulfobacillus acetoxydans]|uniref:HNH endonuclease n=1 Tax=Acididesulfobacillus acetoxydans TaxID=1561005 RepID=A0A8S0XD51_9FIRM|nr:HNH endonuclease [Acididesulfobacillus acetoxydans]CAA7603136.1 HNH endonuclease [Acididesulfobacillus acetoxydans]CEJ07636.1 HNH endonuclease [Acididesulfobacillus acetoxydans]
MPENKIKRIDMHFAFSIADKMISLFNSDDVESNLNTMLWIDAIEADDFIKYMIEENSAKLLKPDKNTLLHEFIRVYFINYLKNERYYFVDSIIEDLELEFIKVFLDAKVKVLNEYNISVKDYPENLLKLNKEFEDSNLKNDSKYTQGFREICDEIIGLFENIEGSVVTATFYLLLVLFQFNFFLSAYMNQKNITSDVFDESGHIRRCTVWLKKAIYFRDRGKCQHCGKDLTGLLNIVDDKGAHFDHVVPLEKGGSNDSTNFQLLCDECNLTKSYKMICPNYFYQIYW